MRSPFFASALAAAGVSLFSLLALVPAARADCNDPFGKPNEVLDFHIRLKRADWRALLASTIRNVDSAMTVDSPACMDKFREFPAEFRCGSDGPWLNVAVRKKKGTERGVEAPEKPPLKIDINQNVMGQRWPASLGDLGFRKLTLNNGNGNKPAQIAEPLLLPILLSEHVALRLLKREVPASPGTAFAKVTLYFEDRPQGEYHGVYVLVEDIDRTAIRRRFGVADGRLIKASTPDCSPEVQYDDGPPNDALAAFDAWIAKDPARFPGMWTAESAKGVDLDALLRQEAIREILVNGNDTILNSRAYLVWGTWGMGNNWLAFDPKVGVRQFIPWDVDLTFGNQNGACAPSNLMCAPSFKLVDWCNPTPMTPSTPQTKSKAGLATACNPEIQKRYLQIMCQLTNGPLSAAEIVKVWDQADAAVRPVIPLEKDFIWGGRDPLNTAIQKSYGAEYARLKAWIPQRIQSVQQQITALGVPCSPGCPAGGREACTYLGCPGERRCENNLWTECRQMNPACPPKASPTPPPGDGGAAGRGGAGGAGGAGGGSVDGGAAGRDGGNPGTGGAAGNPGGTGGNPGTGGSPGGNPGGTGGGGGASPGTGGVAGTTGTGGTTGGGKPDPSGGCSCALGTTTRPPGSSLLVLLLLLSRRLRPRTKR